MNKYFVTIYCKKQLLILTINLKKLRKNLRKVKSKSKKKRVKSEKKCVKDLNELHLVQYPRYYIGS